MSEEQETSIEESGSTPEPVKYFVHGLAFSLLLIVLTVAWVFVAVLLVIGGFIIGLIIAFAVLFFAVGFLNAVLADLIWGVSIKMDILHLGLHGLVLFLVLAVASIPNFLLQQAYPGVATIVVMFLVYAFIDGYIARWVATLYEEDDDEGAEIGTGEMV